MSEINGVLQETWRLGEDGLAAYVSVEGQRFDERVFRCDHSIVKDKLERTQARARLACAAPKLARNFLALRPLVEELHVLIQKYPVDPAIEALRLIDDALAAVREVAGE